MKAEARMIPFPGRDPAVPLVVVGVSVDRRPDNATRINPILFRNLRRPGSWKLYALGVDGGRRDEIPVQAAGDHQTIRIDTGALPAGPTPFFELVADPR